jgi:hypothetical protein
MQNENGSNWSEAVRASLVTPWPRCANPHSASPGGVCGEIARYQGRVAGCDGLAFFCELHRPISAWAIEGEQLVRRVRLHLEVYIAAVDTAPGDGQTEAYDRLEGAIRRAGGITSVLAVTSETVKGTPPAASGGKRMARVRG